jgi:PAS domain S-box-containing protein
MLRIGYAPGSVRRRLLLLALAIIVSAVAGAALVVADAYRSARAQSERQLIGTARALSLVVDRQLGQSEALLRALATSPDLARGDLKAFERQVRVAQRSPRMWILLYSLDGRQLINTRLPEGVAPPPQRPSVLAQARPVIRRGNTLFCNLTTGPLTKGPVLCVAVPVMSEGRIAYALAAVFEPALLNRVLDDQSLPQGWYGAILDREFRTVARMPEPQRFVGRLATPDMRERLRASALGVKPSRSLDGVPTYAAYSRSSTTGWSFIVAMPRAELAAGVRRSLALGIAGLAALLAVGGIVAIRAAGALTRPIERLAADARRLGHGMPVPSAKSGIAEIDAVRETLAQAARDLHESEARLQLAQQAGQIGVWELDTDNGTLWWSETLYAMLGHDPEQPITPDTFVGLIVPGDRAAALAAVADLKDGDTFEQEFRVRLPSGETRWLASRGRCFGGPPRRLVGINFDVSEARRMAAALGTANAELETRVAERTAERDRAWRLSRDIFVTMDRDSTGRAINPAVLDTLGWTPEELVGTRLIRLVHPDDETSAMTQLVRAASGQVVERYACRMRRSDDDYRWISWTAVPEGDLIQMVGRDITAEVVAREQLQRTQAALHEAQKLETLGQLTGGVAHDFNNLLTPIVGSLDLLQRRFGHDARAGRLIDGALQSAERARLLVDRLLSFARRQALQPRATDVRALVQGMTDLIGRSLGPTVRLSVDLPEALPPVSIDPNQLELALLNLCVNARDAMPGGGRLTIAAGESTERPAQLPGGRYLRLTVTDTGSGMDAETLRRAIEPFFSTKGIGKGTGLGLSMVHGLAAQSGGALTLDSTPGEGTSASLWLPVCKAPVEAAATGGAARQERHSATVLLVDDEPVVRAATAEMLEGIGCIVVEAASGPEALRLLDAGVAVDALVTDQLMPDMLGSALVEAAQAKRPGLPALIVTGYANDDLPEALPRLMKPFRSEELSARLGEMLERVG